MKLGGHAIMLGVELPEELNAIADKWVAASPSDRTRVEDPHVTVAFLGRDMPSWVGDAMIQTVMRVDISVLMPRELVTDGTFAMFGGSKDMMVAKITAGPAKFVRGLMQSELLVKYGIDVDTTFGFNPHVSLAKGVFGDVPPDVVVPMKLKIHSLVAKIGSNNLYMTGVA